MRRHKTNAVRTLEAKQVRHEIFTYDIDENMDAVSVSRKLSVSPEEIFKTIVTQNEKQELFVFCIPGNSTLHLKKAAVITGSKSIDLLKTKDLLSNTGYVRGGCSPIGMIKKYPTFVDEFALALEMIFVSAGVRGMQIRLAPQDLAELCAARFAELV